jgi:hypothetical protein
VHDANVRCMDRYKNIPTKEIKTNALLSNNLLYSMLILSMDLSPYN